RPPPSYSRDDARNDGESQMKSALPGAGRPWPERPRGTPRLLRETDHRSTPTEFCRGVGCRSHSRPRTLTGGRPGPASLWGRFQFAEETVALVVRTGGEEESGRRAVIGAALAEDERPQSVDLDRSPLG